MIKIVMTHCFMQGAGNQIVSKSKQIGEPSNLKINAITKGMVYASQVLNLDDNLEGVSVKS